MTAVRRAVPLLMAALVLWASAGQAEAVGYRYWSFWERDGHRWTYATQGPSTARPVDGDVQGFRFAVSAASSDATRPRGTADFDTICSATPAAKGKKRVALVIDFGTSADAPSGETPPTRRTACARVSPDATTAEALAAVAKPLRYDTNALLCAISGYPQKGCGEQVSAEKKAPAEKATSTDHHGPSVGLLAGVGVVVLLGAAAVWQARRRRNA
ncbi:SCO2322 family protein [Streptomyces sp. HUAS TT20]|uniref:SCO2322 family protein n=1 Tax=Streptomyces sp. HUAS TT20 TaxID=3447509 RepID=UPI0021DA2CA1|nr:SCO2322 family protein [Streptomyces sp. HUAS 15-9]UXY27276.1 SCO2322 family protein [Streptomyces sp. HUAS 15-9]